MSNADEKMLKAIRRYEKTESTPKEQLVKKTVYVRFPIAEAIRAVAYKTNTKETAVIAEVLEEYFVRKFGL
jgi:predicted hydrolase (HD superfamily)